MFSFSGAVSGVEGYQSVRKWTAKFDLFKKKYLIVPINEKYVFVLEMSVA